MGVNAAKQFASCYTVVLAPHLRRLRETDRICSRGASELNNGREAAVQESYTSTATLLITKLSLPLKVVVEHSRMANQTHSFGSFHCAGSDHRATPRTNNIVRGFKVFDFVVGLKIHVSTHANRRRQISFQLLPVHPGINEQP